MSRFSVSIWLGVGIPPAIRLDGQLRFIGEPITSNDHIEMLSAILSPSQIETLNRDKELDFSFTFRASEDLSSRFRGNCSFERATSARPSAS